MDLSLQKTTAVIYCTHVINDAFEYFMNNGYIANNTADFYICFNGDFNAESYKTNSRELGLNNIFFHQRPNVGHDFSGWAELLFLENDNKKVHEKYDYYIFINSSCTGPFVPLYVDKNWIDLFTNMITDTIKLVGPTLSLHLGEPHIQSYMMCTDRIGIDIGIKNDIFRAGGFNGLSKWAIIGKYEIGFSKKILEAGYNIKSLFKAYNNVNVLEYSKSKNFTNIQGLLTNGDNCFENCYCGITFHPYEVIFFKSNRKINEKILETYRALHHSIDGYDYFSKIFLASAKKQIIVHYASDKIAIDITDKFIDLFVKDNNIIIPKECIFNEKFGDIHPDIAKKITIIISNSLYPELVSRQYIIDEVRKSDIVYKF